MADRDQGRDDSSGASAPLVVGLGRTGLRITSQLASTAGRAVRLLAVFAGHPPGGPSPVPILAWPIDDALWAEGAAELRGRVGSPQVAVLAFGLGAPDVAAIAPGLAAALRRDARVLAAVGVSPFSFEGPAKVELAETVVSDLGAVVDVFAVVRRDAIRLRAPDETTLQQACQLVDDVGAQVTEVFARSLAGPAEAFVQCGVCTVGAGEASGAAAAADAVRAALNESLLDGDELRASGDALLALVTGRTPTLGDVCAAEELLRTALAPGARQAFEMAVDPALGDRALAAVCVPQGANDRADGVYPSEDPRVLDVPAFLRRRSSSAVSVAGGRRRWLKSA